MQKKYYVMYISNGLGIMGFLITTSLQRVYFLFTSAFYSLNTQIHFMVKSMNCKSLRFLI